MAASCSQHRACCKLRSTGLALISYSGRIQFANFARSTARPQIRNTTTSEVKDCTCNEPMNKTKRTLEGEGTRAYPWNGWFDVCSSSMKSQRQRVTKSSSKSRNKKFSSHAISAWRFGASRAGCYNAWSSTLEVTHSHG